MSWSSSIVSPPGGDMRDYYRSLQLLLSRDDAFYLPGHGPVLPEPLVLVQEMLAHRKRREAAILAQIGRQSWSVAGLAAKLYDKTNLNLKIAARANVLAHLLKLQAEGVVSELAPEDATTPDPTLAALVAASPARPDGPELIERIRRHGLRRFALRPLA